MTYKQALLCTTHLSMNADVQYHQEALALWLAFGDR
jgi:hypothetical protein